MTLVAREMPVDLRQCLIVDDEQPLRNALVRMMQRDGFTCLEAGSAFEAIEILGRARVSLVLSDMKMPGMEGSELLRYIRHSYPDVAVVMITGVTEVGVAVECLALGAMDYLTKPFLLEEVRARVAQALERRRLVLENRDYQERLEERVMEQAERLETLFLASVQSLAEALELKDPYTAGHSVRVSRYATAIARALQLDADTVGQIDLGGHLHDIGKIGVREAVLNKNGRLTPEEYEHIMTHPVLGWRILRPLLADSKVALNVVLSHHERFDGRGVPDQLRGHAIPQEARIASVADAFDAMVSVRPYRQGRSVDDAVAELETHAGSQFDAEVVRAFIGLIRTGLLDRTQPLDRIRLDAPLSV